MPAVEEETLAVGRDLRTRRSGLGERAARLRRRIVPSPHGRFAQRIKGVALRTRSRHLFLYDVGGMLLASLTALAIVGHGSDPETLAAYFWIIGMVVATRIVVDIHLGLYRHSWRFASVPDMWRIVTCIASGTVVAMAIVLIEARLLPQSAVAPSAGFWLVEALVSFTVLAAPRFAVRTASELPSSQGRKPTRSTRALLYGAGWAGITMARSSLRRPDSGITAVGFLDDDPDLAGRRAMGLPIYGGLAALEVAVRETRATALLITMPSAGGSVVRRIVEKALELRLEVRTVPPFTDLLDGSLDASRLRSVRVEDLLRRPTKDGHASPAIDVFQGRNVVITGAAGSIGSELARQVTILRPRRIVLVDRAESQLYLVQRELEDRLRQARENESGWGDTEVSAQLVNVASRAVMRRLFERERPDVVLHAAAFKHVPMLEDNPSEAVQVNIGGTLSVVDAAAAVGASRFILVSTDKAVWPSSVMGASKRVAEMLVADAARRLGLPFAAVRFGNVLGSNGSVVPIFQGQLEKGEALTITDPDMTRYFMTIPEAAWLIVDAASLATPGDLFALDMGEPVRIMDLARDLARLSGRDPDSVPIRITGLRKGEKLHEELFYDQEHVERTETAKVLRTRSAPPPPDVRDVVARLIALADGEHDDEVASSLHAFVRESVTAEEEMWRKRRIAIEIVDRPGPAWSAGRVGGPVVSTRPVESATGQPPAAQVR